MFGACTYRPTAKYESLRICTDTQIDFSLYQGYPLKTSMFMDKRYLLYIDILGFSQMAEKNPKKIPVLYAAIDRLNSHKHNVYKTIVFSDTI